MANGVTQYILQRYILHHSHRPMRGEICSTSSFATPTVFLFPYIYCYTPSHTMIKAVTSTKYWSKVQYVNKYGLEHTRVGMGKATSYSTDCLKASPLVTGTAENGRQKNAVFRFNIKEKPSGVVGRILNNRGDFEKVKYWFWLLSQKHNRQLLKFFHVL